MAGDECSCDASGLCWPVLGYGALLIIGFCFSIYVGYEQHKQQGGTVMDALVRLGSLIGKMLFPLMFLVLMYYLCRCKHEHLSAGIFVIVLIVTLVSMIVSNTLPTLCVT